MFYIKIKDMNLKNKNIHYIYIIIVIFFSFLNIKHSFADTFSTDCGNSSPGNQDNYGQQCSYVLINSNLNLSTISQDQYIDSETHAYAISNNGNSLGEISLGTYRFFIVPSQYVNNLGIDSIAPISLGSSSLPNGGPVFPDLNNFSSSIHIPIDPFFLGSFVYSILVVQNPNDTVINLPFRICSNTNITICDSNSTTSNITNTPPQIFVR